MMDEVPKLDLSISEAEPFDDVRNLLQRIQKKWKTDDIRFKEFSNGYTNKLVACMQKDDGQMKDAVVVRIYGRNTNLMIDREKEIQFMVLLFRAGCAPPLRCRFNNGFAYGYIPGRVLDLRLVHDERILRLITNMLARVHSVRPEVCGSEDNRTKDGSAVQPRLFVALEHFLHLIPESFDKPEKQKKLQRMTASKLELKKEMEYLRQHLLPMGSPVVLCHNDLQFNNILYSEETQKVALIDFEYAGFNYQAFDIASHFCEYAGMEKIDYSNLPDRTYQLKWLRMYLESSFELQGKSCDDVSDSHVKHLYEQVSAFMLAAHLFWATWSLVQSRYSVIDYDYLDYSSIRLDEYYRLKRDGDLLSNSAAVLPPSSPEADIERNYGKAYDPSAKISSRAAVLLEHSS